MKLSICNQLPFQSTGRTIVKNNNRTYETDLGYLSAGDVIFSNYTSFFRGYDCSLFFNQWNSLMNLFYEKFKDAKKVNFYDFGCSDGSEACSIAIALKETLGDRSEKFFPIKAFDGDEYIVEQAKSGIIDADKRDISNITNFTFGKLEKYFNVNKKDDNFEDYPYTLKSKDILSDNIQFAKGDFLSELDNVEKSNSIIFCRNFWPYLSPEYIDKVLLKLEENLDQSSIVVIGNFDRTTPNTAECLRNLGFREIKHNVFSK